MAAALIEWLDSLAPLRNTERRPPGKTLLRIVLVALVLRLILVLFVFNGIADPSGDHQEFGQEVGWIARSIALHHGFSSPFFPSTGPTALLPPLYPYLLSIVFRIFGVYTAKSAFTILSLNSVFSALTCIPIYFATRTSLNARFAMLAGWAWAIYPFAIYFSAGRVWEYSLTSLLFTTCFLMALHLHRFARPASWIAFGLLYDVTALSNPAVLSLLPFLLLLAVLKIQRTRGPWLRNSILAILCTLAVVIPWTVRNYRTLHILCPVRDDFWDELWAGNNGDTSNPTLAWTHPASGPLEMQLFRDSGEVSYLAHKRVLVVDYLTHHPIAFLGLSLRRVVCYWTGFWSLDPRYVQAEPFQLPNVFFCTSLTLLMLLGARTWWRTDPAIALPYLVLIAVFPLTYYISHPLMDYRQPIEPEIVVFVIIGLHHLKGRLKARRAVSNQEQMAAV
jgi:4-amino-4-deoxy-L-arabinose transferase-like glycosyltransferase